MILIGLFMPIQLKAQIPAGYTLVKEARGVQLYQHPLEGYVHVIDLEQGAKIESMLGRADGQLYFNNGVYTEYTKRTVDDFWNDWAAEQGNAAFSVVNGSFYWEDTNSAVAISFPIKHRGGVKTLGFGNHEPNNKRMLQLNNGRAQIVDYDGANAGLIESDAASDIVVGLEIGQKWPQFPLRRTVVGVGGRLDNGGYSKIYVLTSLPMQSSRAAQIVQNFGAIQAMVFDAHWSTQISAPNISGYTIDRPVPHAMGIAAAATPKTYFVNNVPDLPHCGTTTICDNDTYIGGVIQATATIDNNQITFEVSKCNGTPFGADGYFYIREAICDVDENYLVGGSYSAGQMRFEVSTALPNHFSTTCKSYHVIITPGAQYTTGKVEVCLESIVDNSPDLQDFGQVATNNFVHISTLATSFHQTQISPNPTAGSFALQLAQPLAQALTVELYNSTGTQLSSTTIAPQTSTLTLNKARNLPAGLYFVTLTAEGMLLERFCVVVL
ncbi:MAG: T9SS type A sorting domain-containing protein [Aureispira sp.]